MKPTGTQLATLIADFANGQSKKETQALTEVLTREHRTIQRNVFCLCLDIIEAFSEMEQVDLRNQAMRDMARDICNEKGYYKGSRPPYI